MNDYRGIHGRPNAQFVERRCDNGELRMSIWTGTEAIKKGEEITVSVDESGNTHSTSIGIGSVGKLRKVVVESQETATVVVVSWPIRRRLGEETEGSGLVGGKVDTNKTKHRKELSFSTVYTLQSLLCTPGRTVRCFTLNRNPGVMAGLATSAGISSFITWSTCSGHRSLNGLRSFATYAAARRSNIPNRRVLDRASHSTGPSQISRVCFTIPCFSFRFS